MPEVNIAIAYQINSYENNKCALDALNAYLLQINAKATWADVRPIEECAICGEDFNTTESHQTLALSVETGTDEAPELIEIEYPARFCRDCVPSIKELSLRCRIREG
jgi:hypothetical protein